MNIKELIQKISAAVLILFLTITVSQAQTSSNAPSTTLQTSSTDVADPTTNPVLAQFIKEGAKVYYMGTSSGLQGWLLTKDKQVQIAYTVRDQGGALVGILLDNNGNSVTSQQIKKLYDTNKEVNAFFGSFNNQQGPQAMPITPPTADSIPASTNSLFSNDSNLSPGERLMQALQNAAGVDVGASTAPKMYMIVDPNCPHCHKTWKAFRTAVYGGKLQIRLVPIGAITPDSERAAAQFLHVANPLDTWDKYVDGDRDQLKGTPDTNALIAIRGNHELVDSWNIKMTPYIIYRAKDGQVKIVQSEPEKPEAIVDDVGR